MARRAPPTSNALAAPASVREWDTPNSNRDRRPRLACAVGAAVDSRAFRRASCDWPAGAEFRLRRLPPRDRAVACRASPTSNTLAAPGSAREWDAPKRNRGVQTGAAVDSLRLQPRDRARARKADCGGGNYRSRAPSCFQRTAQSKDGKRVAANPGRPGMGGWHGRASPKRRLGAILRVANYSSRAGNSTSQMAVSGQRTSRLYAHVYLVSSAQSGHQPARLLLHFAVVLEVDREIGIVVVRTFGQLL